MKATIIDAGVGNLGNLSRALRFLGADAEITDQPATVAASACLLLPGVGAFKPPRERLRGALEEAIRSALDSGAWLLGICIGYQLLFESSEEFGDCDGLGLLPGRITRLPSSVPLPQIGWNRLHDLGEHALVGGVPEGSYAYFVHTFAPEAVPDASCLARCTHGRVFAAMAAEDRVLGAQFHPEKSGALGLGILRNYLEISGAAPAGA